MKTVTWFKGILFLFVSVTLAGCPGPVSGPGASVDLLEEALSLAESGDDPAALKLLEKGLGADTLDAYSRPVADMLMLKRRL